MIPAAARYLLDQIGSIETGVDGPGGYRVLYGHKELKYKVPITELTLDTVIGRGPFWTRAHGSSAAGRYQFLQATLKDLKQALNYTGDELFDPELQDRMGFHLLRRRGYDTWIKGTLKDDQFALNLSKEWASFPVPFRVRGQTRIVAAGQSYYAGDGLNKALVSVDRVTDMLAHAKTLEAGPEKEPLPLDTDMVADDPPPTLWAGLKAAWQTWLKTRAV
jgi:muramidase (phage lysozyme)